MPIQTRLEMLTTGIRSQLGIKVFGNDLSKLEEASVAIEQALADLRGTRSVFAERATGGFFLDVKVNRQEASRFGLSVQDVNEVVMTAIGGMNVSETVEGRERYPIQVRYAREFRDHPEALKRVLVATPTGVQVPLPQVANVEFVTGPPMIRSEDGQLVNSDGKHVARAASRSANLPDRCEPGTCYSITPSCFMNESMSK